MNISFIRADIVKDEEFEKLINLEKEVFSKSDRFLENTTWCDEEHFEVWWVLREKACVGYIVLYRELIINWEENSSRKDRGYLYIGCTAILPEYRGLGIGKKIKMWQIRYAKREGFKKIQTCCRKSNLRMIGINKRFGFIEKNIIPHLHEDPAEDAIILEYTL